MFIKGQSTFGVAAKVMPQFSQNSAKPFSAVTGQALIDTKTLTKKNNNLRHYRILTEEDQEIANPLFVSSGGIKLNPGGALVTKTAASSQGNYVTNEIAKRMVIAGKRARNFLIAKQYTELEFLQYEIEAGPDSDLMDTFALFALASIYNTNYYYWVLRSLLQAQGILEAVVNYLPDTEATVSSMVQTLSRRKYVTAVNSFISALSKLPCSKECIDIITSATGYEKANDSYDTAFHWVPYNYKLTNEQVSAFSEITPTRGAAPRSLVIPQLSGNYVELPIFTPEIISKFVTSSGTISKDYLSNIVPTSNDINCSEDGAFVKYQDILIKFIEQCVYDMTKLIVLFTPYQTAMSVLGDSVDTSIMLMNSDPVKLASANIQIPNTANAINYQAMITSGLTATENAAQATIDMSVPVFSNYSILPIYRTSGVLNMVRTNEGYEPVVDISNARFLSMIIIADLDTLTKNKLLEPYSAQITTKSSSGYGVASILIVDTNNVPTLFIKGDPTVLTPISYIGKNTYSARLTEQLNRSIKSTPIVNELNIGKMNVSYTSIFSGLSHRAASIVGLKPLS